MGVVVSNFARDVIDYPALVTREDIDDRTKFIVHESFVCHVDGLTITVPEGFRNDWSSVPRVTPIIDFRQLDVSGTVHDYLYRTAFLPRLRADYIWRVLSMDQGAARWRARVAWGVLRAVAWWHWRDQPFAGPYRPVGLPLPPELL